MPCLPSQWLSHVRFFVTTWAAAYQAPLSVGFPWQEYWSGLLGISLTQESNLHLLRLLDWQVYSLLWATWEALVGCSEEPSA